jgi:hypothetical protein
MEAQVIESKEKEKDLFKYLMTESDDDDKDEKSYPEFDDWAM